MRTLASNLLDFVSCSVERGLRICVLSTFIRCSTELEGYWNKPIKGPGPQIWGCDSGRWRRTQIGGRLPSGWEVGGEQRGGMESHLTSDCLRPEGREAWGIPSSWASRAKWRPGPSCRRTWKKITIRRRWRWGTFMIPERPGIWGKMTTSIWLLP